MTKLLILNFLILSSLLVTTAFAQEASPNTTTVSTTASAFQVIDDVRAENGDADLLFIQAGIARNEAAIEAAKAILKTSFDADIRMLAGDSLKAHDSELRALKAWLNLHGPKDTGMPLATPTAPATPKVQTVVASKPVVPVPAVTAVTPSLPIVEPSPIPTSTEVTITTPRVVSETQPPLPGSDISMNPIKEPTMQLLDVPPIPASFTTPVTH